MGKNRLGILGGTFDPVHNGHLDLATMAARALDLSQVLFIPASVPPHKDNGVITAFESRYRMVELAIENQAGLAVSDMENNRLGNSYTYDTLKILRQTHSDWELFFLTGADVFEGFMKWYRWRDILDLCTVVVTTRPGFVFEASPELQQESSNRQGGIVLLEKTGIDISATAIRTAIQKGDDRWRTMVPHQVAEYILENKLYRG